MHTLASKINPEFYIKNKHKIIGIIKGICNGLPCPICKAHATRYVQSLKPGIVPTKNHLIEYLKQFHNNVNKMNGKIVVYDVSKYERFNIILVFKQFIKIYTNRYYVGKFVDSIKRKKVSNELHSLLYYHRNMFI